VADGQHCGRLVKVAAYEHLLIKQWILLSMHLCLAYMKEDTYSVLLEILLAVSVSPLCSLINVLVVACSPMLPIACFVPAVGAAGL